MRAGWMVMAICASVAACAVPGQNPYGSLATAKAPSAASAPLSAPVFATELAGPETILPPLPTAVVILRAGATARNTAFCQAAAQLPTVRQAEAGSVVAPNLIHTRWLLQITEVPPGLARNCDFLVASYDYARAARLAASVRPLQGGLAGQGPYLLMIIPGETGMHVAGLDGSGYPDAEMNRFVAAWSSALVQSQRQIAANPDRPGLARSVFDLVSAILSTVAGGAHGLVTGTLSGL